MSMMRIFCFTLFSLLLTVSAEAASSKVYLVNGLFSKAFGYGLTNLSKKIPQARHFKFAGGVTQATIDGIISDATNAYKKDSSTKISLVGISQGANAITSIAAALGRNGVKVYYMAIIEGGSMTPIGSNVRKADSFVCTGTDCARRSAPRASGNSTTDMNTITLNTNHIASGDDASMHRRVIAQIQ
jgi:hypothetical protein